MHPPQETSLGGRDRRFPSTRWTIIRDARDPASPDSRKALDELCRIYWKPVYAYLRSRREISNEEAKDLTQEFFLDVAEGGFLQRYSPATGSFRSYLLGAVHLFLLEQHRNATTRKRGGGKPLLSLDDQDLRAVEKLAASGRGPEEAFELQWAKTVIDESLSDLKEELKSGGKEKYVQVLEKYGLGPRHETTYGRLAEELGIKESDISNYLVYCRKRLRELAIERIRDYVEGEADAGDEVVRIFHSLTSD